MKRLLEFQQKNIYCFMFQCSFACSDEIFSPENISSLESQQQVATVSIN